MMQRMWGAAAIAAAALVSVLPAPGPTQAQTRLEQKTDPPILRSLNWFRYVAGADIRAECRPGAADRMRLVYNALWREQVRTYDIVVRPDGSAHLSTRVFVDIGNVGEIFVSDPADLLGPWKAKRAEREVSSAERARLDAAFTESAAFGPPPRGRELPSNDFWWTVASCRAGVWGFQAYHHPSDGFARVKFAEPLFALDGTGVRVNPPRRLEPAEFRGERTQNWRLAVGQDRLRDY